MTRKAVVLDASALLAYMFQEPGHEVVANYLEESCISSVNLLEVASRLSRDGVSPKPVLEMIQTLGIAVVPFSMEHVSTSARLAATAKQYGLSMADRICLGLGLDLSLPVLTGDTTWVEIGLECDVILFRNDASPG